MHVKGLDLPGYDPRVLRGMALAYGTSARGACHLRATYYKAELSGAGFENPEKKAEDYIDYEDRLTLFDSIIMCKFYRDLMPWEEIKKCLGVLTGVNYGFRELRETAGRIVTATRVFNYREGFGKSDDALPPRLHQEPLNGKVLAREEYDAMLHAYYRFRGWSREGVPKDNKIKEVLLRQ
jgi:aldehyde:ferredoxin oxidoreductase